MSKFLTLCLLLICSHEGLSQNYRVLRAAFGVGITKGVIAYFEPSVRITDRISVGYRSEGGVFPIDFTEYYQVASKGAVVQYYFEMEDGRFFIGLGLATYKCSPSNYSRADDPRSGFFPRLGFDVGHFTLCFDYNVINDFSVSKYPPHSFPTTEMDNRSYFSVRFGLVIGGGRKKNVESQFSPVLQR